MWARSEMTSLFSQPSKPVRKYSHTFLSLFKHTQACLGAERRCVSVEETLKHTFSFPYILLSLLKEAREVDDYAITCGKRQKETGLSALLLFSLEHSIIESMAKH